MTQNLMEVSDLTFDPCFKVRLCLLTAKALYLPQRFHVRLDKLKSILHRLFKFGLSVYIDKAPVSMLHCTNAISSCITCLYFSILFFVF